MSIQGRVDLGPGRSRAEAMCDRIDQGPGHSAAGSIRGPARSAARLDPRPGSIRGPARSAARLDPRPGSIRGSVARHAVLPGSRPLRRYHPAVRHNEGVVVHGPQASALVAGVLAAAKGGFSKHDLAGVVAVVVGVAIVVFGAIRVMARVAGAIILPVIGLVILIIGILFFTRTL
jgi:hypothetical protein